MSLVPEDESSYDGLALGGSLSVRDVSVPEDVDGRRKVLEEELLRQVEVGGSDRNAGALSRVVFDVVGVVEDRLGVRRILRRLEMTRLEKVFAELYFVTGDRSWSFRRACELLGVGIREAGVRAGELFDSEAVGRYLVHLENRYRGVMEGVLLREWEKVLRVRREVAYASIGDIMDFSGDQVRLKPAREIPRSALRAIRRLKVQRVTLPSGESRETVEVELESRVPHLEAIEERYSRLPELLSGGGTESLASGGGSGETSLVRHDPVSERCEALRSLVEELRRRGGGG